MMYPPTGDELKRRMMQALDTAQANRYEAFKRSSLKKPNMKRLVQCIIGQVPNVHVTIAMCGITKLFVCELVETARMIAYRRGHSGPLLPSHIHHAYQVLLQAGKTSEKLKTRIFR